EVRNENGKRVTLFHTLHGTLKRVDRHDPGSASTHPVEFPVNSLAELKILTEFYADATAELDKNAVSKAAEDARRLGERGPWTTSAGTSALMDFVQHLAGIENAHYLLADHPEEVAALFAEMHRLNRRKVEILCAHSPADLIYMVENTSTTLISPAQYKTLCYPHIREYAQLADDAGRALALHMCGKLKLLLPDLADVPARVFEAFTTPPVGDTTFGDGRAGCPNKCLVGGTDATLWLKSPHQIIAQLEAHLAALPHHRGLVVSSAGVMPPAASPEKIKTVFDWVKGYKVRA
ncbi:MAG: hypothetical protein NTW86_30705, partial [Candidatus Sumerlaeota bacterium]|nr:hypothetical protein [Candidatus Sumerlaeota bacterium]